MEDSAHRAKAIQDNLRNTVPAFAEEKTSDSRAAATKQDGEYWGPIQHI